MAEETEPAEAVIISGPRRGEIVRLAENALPVVSDEHLHLLNRGLELIEAALDRLEGEVRATTEAFRASRWETGDARGVEDGQSRDAEVRERPAPLRGFGGADRARWQADLAQFKLDVEQAVLRSRSSATTEAHP